MTYRARVDDADGSQPYAHDMADGTRGQSGNSYVVGELDMTCTGPLGMVLADGTHRGRHPDPGPLRPLHVGVPGVRGVMDA